MIIPDRCRSGKQRALDVLTIFSDHCIVKSIHKKGGAVKMIQGHWCNKCRSVIQSTTCIINGLTDDNEGRTRNSWQSLGSKKPFILAVTPHVISTFRVIMSCIKLNALRERSLNTTMHCHKSCWRQSNRQRRKEKSSQVLMRCFKT